LEAYEKNERRKTHCKDRPRTRPEGAPGKGRRRPSQRRSDDTVYRAIPEAANFAEGVEKIEDVRPGIRLPGIVTNVTGFGAFVDIGVHHDGLVHASELSNRYVKNPADVVMAHQLVGVTVLDVDVKRRRIALSMKKGPQHKG